MITELNSADSSPNSKSLCRLKSFLEDKGIQSIAQAFNSNTARRKVEIGFNAFALVSDVYHKENLHSDMLAAILDPSGLHNRGDLYLRKFIDFLREHHGLDIKPDSFKGARVARESGRIDLLIFDDISREAIIIENKINGADDMERQAVRYLENVEDKRGYKCAAIVYLTLNLKRLPSYRGWAASEIERITPLLVPIAAFNDLPGDLCDGWLARCLIETSPQDDGVHHVLRQYRQILLKMAQEAMNQPLMEMFLNLLRNPDSHRQVAALATMWNELPAYRCLRLYERFRGRHSPFFAVSLYRPTLLMFEGMPLEKGARVKIHIDTASRQQSLMVFWDNADDDATIPATILSNLSLMDQFPLRDGSTFKRAYSFPAEDDALGDDLEDFLQRLREYVEEKQKEVLS